jgi:hypothetical protein
MYGMFSGASAFNQDLSGWCVSVIEEKPFDFDLDADAWTGNPAGLADGASPPRAAGDANWGRPIWGAPCGP